MNQLRGAYVIPVKLSKAMIEGDWFMACHEYQSDGTSKGDISISAEEMADFVSNFKAGIVRRWPDKNGMFRLKINYEHWGSTFAGWIVDAELREKKLTTGQTVKALWLKAEWTSDAATAIEKEELNYFSIEYFSGDKLYRDDQTGKTYRNVLVGGALTNDPFVMEMEPMALSTLEEMRKQKEALTAPKIQVKEDDMKILLSTLKLAESATEADAVSAVTKLTVAHDDLATKLSVKEAEVTKLTKELADSKTLLSAEQEKVKAFEKKEKDTLTKVAEERKAQLIKLAISGDASKGEKIGKCSKADCEPTGFFGKLLEKDMDLAEEFLSTAKVTGFKTVGGSDETTLSTDEQMAKRMKELMSGDTKLSAEAAHQKVRAEFSTKKEG